MLKTEKTLCLLFVKCQIIHNLLIHSPLLYMRVLLSCKLPGDFTVWEPALSVCDVDYRVCLLK